MSGLLGPAGQMTSAVNRPIPIPDASQREIIIPLKQPRSHRQKDAVMTPNVASHRKVHDSEIPLLVNY